MLNPHAFTMSAGTLSTILCMILQQEASPAGFQALLSCHTSLIFKALAPTRQLQIWGERTTRQMWPHRQPAPASGLFGVRLNLSFRHDDAAVGRQHSHTTGLHPLHIDETSIKKQGSPLLVTAVACAFSRVHPEAGVGAVSALDAAAAGELLQELQWGG